MFDKLKIFFKVSDLFFQEVKLPFERNRGSIVCCDFNPIK